MRILLDEDLPRRLAAMLVGHDVSTVQRIGWAGIKNGKLLGLAAAEFDVFLRRCIVFHGGYRRRPPNPSSERRMGDGAAIS